MGFDVSQGAGARKHTDGEPCACRLCHFEVVAVIAHHGHLRRPQAGEVAERVDGIGRRLRIGDGVVSVSGGEHLRDPQRKQRAFGAAGGIIGRDAELAARREAMDAKGAAAWKPAEQRPRKITPALKAYALLATSADKGAVRDLGKLD